MNFIRVKFISFLVNLLTKFFFQVFFDVTGDYTGDRRLFTKMGLRFGGESRGGYHGAKRGKSPFNLFKKNKLSRDPSPLGSHEYPHGSLPVAINNHFLLLLSLMIFSTLFVMLSR